MSPTYAKEITTPEFAYGLEGLLSGLKSQGRLVGILNGVDENIWHPNADQYIQHRYKLKHMAGKKENKAELQAYFNYRKMKCIGICDGNPLNRAKRRGFID